MKISPNTLFILFFSIALILVGGCATSSVREEQKRPKEITPIHKVAVIPIENLLIDVLFPWFEPDKAPESKEDLEALFRNRLVQERIDKLDVRYVIALSVETGYRYNRSETMIPGLFGGVFNSREYSTDVFVNVFDFKELNCS